MPQQVFNNFKQRLKDGKKPIGIQLVEEEMNSRDAVGYQKILVTLVSCIYQKFISQKANQGTFEDISEIENLFAENKLSQTLLNEFENPCKNTIIPAMPYWLYFGQSFKRMVEKREELRKIPNISYIRKFLIKSTIYLLRNKSISLGLRTKSEWEEHYQLIKEVDDSEVLDLDIDVKTNTLFTKPKNNKELSLEDMIMNDDEKKEILLTKIGDYIRQGIKGKKIAWMILALKQLGYLPNATSDRHLFNAIHERFGLDISSDKSIYAYLDKTTQKYDRPEIEALMNYFNLN